MSPIAVNNTHRFLSLLVLLGAILQACGCDGPNSADAVVRNSKYQPVFGEPDVSQPRVSDPLKRRSSQLDLSFLHEDHFGCIRIRPLKILTSPDFKQIPWDDLESQLAKIVGDKNAELENLDSIWLLLDQSYFDSIASGSDASELPFVAVFDYKSGIDKSSLEKAIKADHDKIGESQDGSKSNSKNAFAVEALNKHRIVIGGPEAIEKLKRGSHSPELEELIADWNPDAAAEAAVILSPIRPMLQGWFDMLSRFGGETQKFVQLPDVIENINLTFNLVGDASGDDVLVLGKIRIEDDQLADELVKTIGALNSTSGSAGMASMIGSGLGSSEISNNLMFTPSSEISISRFVSEIGDKKLFSIRNTPGEIVLQMDRPESLPDVVLAVINDGQKQLEIVERAERLGKIAEAIKTYEEKYQCLPSLNAVSADDSKQSGVPAQFSWRVALLPLMGYSELYDRFDFTKPWDAPENRAIAADMPVEFMASESNDKTTFHLAAGEKSVYRPDRPRPKLSDFSDRKIWTAVVVDAKTDSAQLWTNPQAPYFDQLNADEFGRGDELGIMFINGSFQVRIVKKDDELISKILTSDGDEKMTSKDFIRQK